MLLTTVITVSLFYLALRMLRSSNADIRFGGAWVAMGGGILFWIVPELLSLAVPSKPVIEKTESIARLGSESVIFREGGVYILYLANNTEDFHRFQISASMVEVKKDPGRDKVELETIGKDISFPWNLIAVNYVRKNYIIRIPEKFEISRLSK